MVLISIFVDAELCWEVLAMEILDNSRMGTGEGNGDLEYLRGSGTSNCKYKESTRVLPSKTIFTLPLHHHYQPTIILTPTNPNTLPQPQTCASLRSLWPALPPSPLPSPPLKSPTTSTT